MDEGMKAVWSTAYINDLPDSAFLYIEPGGEKDDEGKTVPRALRHFPYRDHEGKIDLPHLRNAIARIPLSNASGLTAEKKRQLQDKARRLLAEAQKSVVVKSAELDTLTLVGWGVLFGGEDLDGETFSKETDFWLDHLPGPRPVLFDHSFDSALGLKVLGQTAVIEETDDGIWLEMQLDRHDKYVEQIRKLAEAGVLGISSGSVSHLVRKDGKRILSWPIVEFSLTPTPAEPRTLGVTELKSLAEAMPEVKALLPEEPAGEADSASVTVGEAEPEGLEEGEESKTEGLNMETQDLEKLAADAAMKAAQEIMQRLEEETPKVKGKYRVEEEESAKSFGDFLLAIRRGDSRRLAEVYKSTKDVLEGAGESGGYLVPEEFVAELLEAAGEEAIVRPRAHRQPMGARSLRIPMLSQTGGPASAGDPVWFGGVNFHWTEEAAAQTETAPEFKQIELVAHELSGYTQASNAMIADSAVSLDALLRRLFGAAIAWIEDYNFLRGNGVGKPLGVLNAPALLTQTRAGSNAVAYADLAGMLSKFLPSSIGKGVWVMSQTVVPQLLALADSAGNLVWQPNATSPLGNTLFGMPVIFTEKLPALGTEGDVLLADFSYYVIGDRQTLAVDFSEHYAFTSNVGTWRVTERIDGQPWLDAPITLTDGSTQVSPFVALK